MIKKLAIGTVQFGLDYGISNLTGQTSLSDVRNILSMAKKTGIQYLDTAPAYGDSETVLGKVIDDHFRLITKIPDLSQTETPLELFQQSFQQSLGRLNRSEIYGLLAHRASDLLGDYGQPLFDALTELKAEGLVKKIGASVYDCDEIEQLLQRHRIDLVQLPLNVFDQRFINAGQLDALKREGVEIHVRSAFLQGLMLMSPAQLPAYFNPWLAHIKNYHATVSEAGISLLQAALEFVLQQPLVDRLILGINSPAQLNEIIETTRLTVKTAAGTSLDYQRFAVNEKQLVNPTCWNTAST